VSNIKINVVIAGRTYPLNVKDTLEEQGMRDAANNINDLIRVYEENYAVNDKQDVLAMCALHFASKLEIGNLIKENTETEVLEKVQKLTEMVSKHLE